MYQYESHTGHLENSLKETPRTIQIFRELLSFMKYLNEVNIKLWRVQFN